MKSLTIFTPTYNREYCLGQCYERLVNQTNKDFVWLIIDDGSTDNTKTLIDSWIAEGKIDIIYHYQENQGMHGGHNTAYSLIKTTLNVCIDSDDFMPEDAVEKILGFWDSLGNKDKIAGIIGLDAYKNREVIGDQFPNYIKTSTLEDLHHKHNVKGDKKLVYRTDVVKKYPKYPIFPDERFVPLGTLYLLIDKDYELACLNEIFCIVEYMEDGSSRNILKQYYRHPKGFQYARILNIQNSNYLKVRFKNAVHLVSHSLQLKDFTFFKKTPDKTLTFIALPIGFLLYLYVMYLNKVKQ
ncbi:glycosyltransferase family 2 protein [Galbibacter sp. EGI 63066]|uniref:glycosyltransferase family 2 protein n=1 Tax=Galbibacter sp. EGI 63066 TaxID=2993559 RepID=UPI0022487EE3|nr:glycosyltransferase family 2 protein [Galbibacter sp. EGI 63066]MCX2679171.1 glycosyltransferase family 2 protein [Galbibacter sp. EGI 63066]